MSFTNPWKPPAGLITCAIIGLGSTAVAPKPGVANGETAWEGTVSTDWFDPNNWSNAVPTTSEDTTITKGPTPVISGGGHAATGEITIGNDDGDGSLSIAEGVLTSDGEAFIGRTQGSAGAVQVSGPLAQWTIDNNLRVGFSGEGELSVTGASEVQANEVSVGHWDPDGSGTITVSGSGSRLTALGSITVGWSGTGDLSVLNGGRVDAASLSISIFDDGAGPGTVTVAGSGSHLNVTNDLSVGRGADGYFNVLDGATIRTSATHIGRGGAGRGTARLAGQGSVWRNDGLFLLGDTRDGTLTIGSGGRLVIDEGDGELTIANDSGVTGTLNIGAAEGETAIAPGFVEAATLAFDEGTGRVVFNHTGRNYEFTPSITGNGTLVFLAGRTTLVGDARDFTGTTTIEGGTLVADGRLGGTLSFGNGSRLAGTGRIGSTVLQSGATIAPGNSIGTLTIDGDLTFQPGSVYEVEVTPSGTESDLIVVNGTALLAGTVRHLGTAGGYDLATDYLILRATEGFNGSRFDRVTSDFVFLDPTLSYGDRTVTLRLVRNDVDFASVALTRNQRETATGVESLALGNVLYDTMARLTAPNTRAALDLISGEIHASAQSALIDQAGLWRRAIIPQTAETLNGRPPQAALNGGRYRIWAQGYGSWASVGSDDNSASLDHDQQGILIGADVKLDTGFRLGAFTGTGRSDFSVDDRLSSGHAQSVQVGVYGAGTIGPWRLTAGAGHSWHKIETARTVAFSTVTDRPTASYSARTAHLFAEAGYEVDLDPIRIQPFANLAHTRHTVSSFSEAGGAAALSASGTDHSASHGTIGLRASSTVGATDSGARLYGAVGWQHALDSSTPSSRLALEGGSAFTVYGAPIARDRALIEAGLDLAVTDRLSLSASYDGRLDAGGQEHGVNARLTWAF